MIQKYTYGTPFETDIKLQFSGIINEETESQFSGDYDEVVCSVEGDFIFCILLLDLVVCKDRIWEI